MTGNSSKRTFLLAIPALWILGLITSCGPSLSEKLHLIKPGESIDLVKALAGPPTSIVQSQSTTGLNGTVLIYKTHEGSVQVVLINDVVYTVQFGGK